jgi:transposase
MVPIHELEARRNQVLQELGAIRSLRKGNLNEQWLPVVRDGKKTKKLRGPYFVWSYKVGTKTVSERVSGEQTVALARQDAANYRRFRELCAELEQLIAQLGEAERQPDTASDEALKKGLKSRSNRAGKSSG